MTISDLNTFTRFLCDADSTSYTAANLLITINNAYEEIVGDILGADGVWNFDDTNYTSFPRGYQDLVGSQYDYSFNEAFLEIERVFIKDSNGDWLPVRQIDQQNQGELLTEVYETDGIPEVYDIDGDSIILYPAPDANQVTTTNGLQIHFRRTADVFTSAEVTTGTKTPGFPSPYHQILSYMAAIPYCIKYKPDRIPALELKKRELHEKLIKHMGRRNKDVRPALRPRGVNPR